MKWLAAGLLTCFAQAPSSFELRPPAAAVMIGSPVELEGVVRYPEKYELSLDLREPTTGAFEILGTDLSEPERQGGMKVQRLKLKIAAFELGALTLPPLSWRLTAHDSSDSIQSPPVKLEAVGPSAGPESDIRDIKPPLGPPLSALILPLLALAALIGAGAHYYRRRIRPLQATAANAADTRLPHERALDALKALAEADLPVKEYYDRLSDILRAYLEQRFQIPALFLTTSDLLRHMRQSEIDRGVTLRCRELFDRCDLAKFARHAPQPSERGEDLNVAISIIHDTAPVPPPMEAV